MDAELKSKVMKIFPLKSNFFTFGVKEIELEKRKEDFVEQRAARAMQAR